jgi:hypothetical protein
MAVDPRQMRTPVVGNSLQQLAAMRANSGKFPILGNVQPMRPMPPAQSPALPMNENTSEVIKEGAFNAAFETLAKKAGVNIIEGVRDVQQVQQQQQVANLQEAAIRNPAIQRLMMAANDSTIAMQSGGLIGMAEQVDEGEPTNIEGFIEGISSAKDKDEFGVPIIEGSKMDPETGIFTLPDGRLVDNIRYATKRDLVEGIKNHREVLQDRLQELRKGPRSFRDVDGSLLSFPQAPYFGETKVLEIAAKKAEEDLREYDRKASLALMNYDSYIADGNEPMYSEIVGRPSYSSFPINLVNYGRIKNKRFGGLVNMAEGGDLKVAEGGEFSGRVPGDGHGMEDNVRMPIKEGKEQVATLAVSPSEYVVDSYTMAALGNGNTDEGADVMDETVKQIRKKAYGSEKQPNEINGLAALKPLIERV